MSDSKPAVIVRPLTPSDASSFQTLRLFGLQEVPASFASSYEDEKKRSLDDFSRSLQATPDSVVLGAFQDDLLLGVVGIRREALRKYRHKAALWGVYVHPRGRGSGVSRLLISAAIQVAQEMTDVTQINLTVTGENAIALKLYRSLRFEAFGHERDAISVDGVLHDEIHMALCLKAA